MSEKRSIYLAGELFSAKHLAGNAALAEEMGRVSEGRFRCVLPQDLPQGASARRIRDEDLRALMRCDAAVFHYDGLELDSGTVVEYLFAKFADMPAVLLRTDFRNAGDQAGGDPWNLMTSFYPRTETVRLNSMEIYQEALRTGAGSTAAASEMMRRVAGEVCAALEKVMGQPAVLPRAIGAAVYEWLGKMPGFEEAGVAEEIREIYAEKVERGML